MEWLVAVTFVLAILTSLISGMGGGGGGFITIPYFLLVVGMPPANALATAKLGGIGTTLGALTAFRGKGLVHKKLVMPFMILTIIFSVVAGFLIPQIDPVAFQKVIGVALIILIPTLFIKRAVFQPGERSRGFIVAGFIAYALFSFLAALIGTGIGSILVLILMYLFGLGALEANATKRVAQSLQAIILFVLLALQGLVFWWHGVAGMLGCLIGGHLGAHIAIKKGAGFVKIMLAVVMLTSGIALLV